LAARALRSYTIPVSTNLLGRTFFHQTLVVDPGTNPGGAAVSNAAAGQIGGR